MRRVLVRAVKIGKSNYMDLNHCRSPYDKVLFQKHYFLVSFFFVYLCVFFVKICVIAIQEKQNNFHPNIVSNRNNTLPA